MRRKAKDATAAREMLGAIPPLAAMLDEGNETVQTGGMARRVAARPAEVRLAEGRRSWPRSRWNSRHWKRASSSAFFFLEPAHPRICGNILLSSRSISALKPNMEQNGSVLVRS